MINYFYFSILEILILTAVFFTISSDIEHKSILASLLFCIQILLFAFEGGMISKFLKKSFFRLLGRLSYSIYLIHAFILLMMFYAVMLIQKLFDIEIFITEKNMGYMNFGNVFYNNIMLFIVLGIVIISSKISYTYIEETEQTLGRRIKEKIHSQTLV